MFLLIARSRVVLMYKVGVVFAAAVLIVGQVSAATTESQWLEARMLGAEQLLILADPALTPDTQQQLLANLILAERALNQSVAEASKFLAQADAGSTGDANAEYFAQALRCQLAHRQSLPSAAQTCTQLADGEQQSSNRLVQAFIHLTRAYYSYREGDHEQSVEQAYKALALAEMVNDPGLLAAAHNLVGLHFSTRLLPRMSMPHLESAWEQAGKMPNPEFRALVTLNLASNYTYLGRGEEALAMLVEAKELPVVTLYPTRQLVLQSMIAQAEVAAGQMDRTEQDLIEVMDQVSDKVLPDGMTFAYTSLGLVRLATGRPDEALQNFNRVLEITGQDLSTGMKHPRIQLMAADYARALREAGNTQASRDLLQLVINHVSDDQPDQLLVDAYEELALTSEAQGDWQGAAKARQQAAGLEQQLWDASFSYQMARLNASMDASRSKLELERAQERERILTEKAEREKTLRLQSLIIGAMLVAVMLLFQSRRMQKKVAESQRAASEDLEGLVKTRTQELEDEMAERLRVEVDRRRLIEKLSEREKLHALGELTAGVAHDFNNLMAVVSLSADHLKSQPDTVGGPADDELLDNILSAADTGSKITNGLLAYVRKQPLQPVVLQLDEFLKKSLALIKNTLGERIELKIYFEPCTVRADEGQLTTSVLNLVLNAKEAMPGSGTLELRLLNRDDQAEIHVIDPGSGMDEDTQKRAFEPFYTTKDAGEGTGLGLSMVYGFAKQSGGNLTIDSAVGKGTSVILALPMVGDKANLQITAAPTKQRTIARGASALVVEDRELLRQMLDRSLTQLGMQVSVASNADDALALVQKAGGPDLLVSDIVMPGNIDGSELAEKLRERDPGLAVLLISGYADVVDEACRFLRKPFSMSELESAVVAAMSDVSKGPGATQ